MSGGYDYGPIRDRVVELTLKANRADNEMMVASALVDKLRRQNKLHTTVEGEIAKIEFDRLRERYWELSRQLDPLYDILENRIYDEQPASKPNYRVLTIKPKRKRPL